MRDLQSNFVEPIEMRQFSVAAKKMKSSVRAFTEISPAVNGPEDEGAAGLKSSMINILNTILGAGLLAMPHSFTPLGIVLASMVVLLFGSLSAFGLHLLAVCGQRVGRNASFRSISQITYPRAGVFFDAAVAIKCFGVAVSYLVIIGDLMPGVLKDFQIGVDVDLIQHR